jgi:hypothetical protein
LTQRRAAPVVPGAGVIQRVITKNADGSAVDEVDVDHLDYWSAHYAHEQIVNYRLWSASEADMAKINAALAKGNPGIGGAAAGGAVGGKGKAAPGKGKGKAKGAPAEEEAYVPSGHAELSKAKDVQPYLDLIGHLGGEGGGKAVLKGGHLLSEMKKKYPKLKLTGVPDAAAPWEGWWSDGIAEPKWSSFFPSGWTKNDLVKGLWKSGSVKGGRLLPDGTKVSKTGDTFYPWHNETLPKPALKDMPPAP